jgi:hypothetical protein
MIKTFRGKMINDAIDTIHLHTNDGKTGYKIIDFVVFPTTDDNIESTLKIYSILQTGLATNDIDFSDNTLLAAAFYTQSQTGSSYPQDMTIFFDNVIFNQDIYVTLSGHNYTADMNYMVKLEQMPLDLSSNTVATLKDIRNEFTSVTGTP